MTWNGQQQVMKKLLTIAAFGIQAALVPAGAQSLKIGVVDVEQVFKESQPSKAASARLEAEFASRSRELASLDAKLRAGGEQLDKDGPTLSEAERSRRSRDLAAQKRELEQKARAFQEDAETRQQEEQKAVKAKVERALRQIFETEKYDLIVQDGQLHSPAVDITRKVMDAVNAQK
jgi:outer membrane protein